MQSPYVPETPGRSPVLPEEVPATPAPEVPAEVPPAEAPTPSPVHPDTPDDGSEPPREVPEALDIRIP